MKKDVDAVVLLILFTHETEWFGLNLKVFFCGDRTSPIVFLILPSLFLSSCENIPQVPAYSVSQSLDI